MSAFIELLGETLLTKSGEQPTAEALAGKQVVGLYFSAHWCPPCRGFTPKAAEMYKQLVAAGKPFEVVFVSSDRDDASFDEYFGEQPWTALPFKARDIKESLSKKYKVSGIPTLVLLDGSTGEVITKKGREAIMSPEKWPWAPVKLSDILADGTELVAGPGGETTTLKALKEKGTTHIALYFSAHWCGPCRNFTPAFAKTYEAVKAAGKGLEVVFVSSDRDEASFKEYHSSMPWAALPFSSREAKEALSDFFEVQGIPSAVVLDAATLEVVNGDARGAIGGDPTGSKFPWVPPLVKEFDEDPSDLNDMLALVVLAEKAEDSWDDVEKALEPVAAELRAAKEEAVCGICKEMGGVGTQIRKLTKRGQPKATPECVLLDLSDDGGYYEGPSELTTDAVRQLFKDFKAKALTRLQAGK